MIDISQTKKERKEEKIIIKKKIKRIRKNLMNYSGKLNK